MRVPSSYPELIAAALSRPDRCGRYVRAPHLDWEVDPEPGAMVDRMGRLRDAPRRADGMGRSHLSIRPMGIEVARSWRGIPSIPHARIGRACPRPACPSLHHPTQGDAGKDDDLAHAGGLDRTIRASQASGWTGKPCKTSNRSASIRSTSQPLANDSRSSAWVTRRGP